MKGVFLILLLCTGLCLWGCKKSSNKAASPNPQDSFFLQITVDGLVYDFDDPVTPRAVVKIEKNYDQNLLLFLLTAQLFPPVGIAEPTQGLNSLLLQLNLLPGDTVFTPGTYVFTTGFNVGGVAIAQSNWNSVVSDTVTVASLQNGLAAGTFSATFAESNNPKALVHVTNGVFRNIPIDQ